MKPICDCRFVGEAIAHRSGKPSTSVSSKQMKKNMEKFVTTGMHPELEKAHLERMRDHSNKPLPELDQNRPFVFMDISIANKPAGGLMGCAVQVMSELSVTGCAWGWPEGGPVGKTWFATSCSHLGGQGERPAGPCSCFWFLCQLAFHYFCRRPSGCRAV
jgi:hypothetical protein